MPEDATTRLIEDTIRYCESLIADFFLVKEMPPAVRATGRNLGYDLLTVRPDMLLACKRREYGMLIGQVTRLQDVLNTYRAWLVHQHLSQ